MERRRTPDKLHGAGIQRMLEPLGVCALPAGLSHLPEVASHLPEVASHLPEVASHLPEVASHLLLFHRPAVKGGKQNAVLHLGFLAGRVDCWSLGIWFCGVRGGGNCEDLFLYFSRDVSREPVYAHRARNLQQHLAPAHMYFYTVREVLPVLAILGAACAFLGALALVLSVVWKAARQLAHGARRAVPYFARLLPGQASGRSARSWNSS